MFTINYKGLYIHGYADKPACRINNGIKEFKSLHAAKLYVTRVMLPAFEASMQVFSEIVKHAG